MAVPLKKSQISKTVSTMKTLYSMIKESKLEEYSYQMNAHYEKFIFKSNDRSMLEYLNQKLDSEFVKDENTGIEQLEVIAYIHEFQII